VYVGATIASVGQLYYDYPNRQLRMDDIGIELGKNSSVHGLTSSWLDYSSSIGYTLFRDTGMCESYSLVFGMVSLQIPPDASYEGSALLGTQSVDTWLANFGGGYDTQVTVTTGTCYTLSISQFNATTGEVYMVESIWNVTPGLPLFYFDIPQACLTAKKSNPDARLRSMFLNF